MPKALVVGMGKSGKSAYTFLSTKGWSVVGTDDSAVVREELSKNGWNIENNPSIENFDLIVPSPGIPPSHLLVKKALFLHKPCIGEICLGLELLSKEHSIIGITGTNGKTTVTLLITHVLNSLGYPARAVGNIGEPFTSYALQPVKGEILVAEISSYQLEPFYKTTERQEEYLDVALLLNISPDHLDWHGSLEAYAQSKFSIQNWVKKEGSFYINLKTLQEHSAFFVPKRDLFTWGSIPGAYWWVDKERMKKGEEIELEFPPFLQNQGMHDRENILAAWIAVQKWGIKPEDFLQALSTFKKPVCRIEFVEEIEGVRYVDDSKGTNIDATIQAVKSMEGNVILIAGGVHKGASYKEWIEVFKNKVETIIAIGEAASLIEQDLSQQLKVERAISLEEAVIKAHSLAKRGQSVLLSPGCASFDMFKNFEDRGLQFKAGVDAL